MANRGMTVGTTAEYAERKREAMEIISKLRRKGIRVVDIAKEMDVTYMTVYVWKVGKHSPREENMDLLKKYARRVMKK